MTSVTLEQVNNNILNLKKEVDEIKEMLEEPQLDLSDDAKKQIKESRKRPTSTFKSQEEMEAKFL